MELKSRVKGCLTFFRYLIFLSVPLAVEIVVLASYFKLVEYHLPIHTVVTISVIFIIFLFFLPTNSYITSCKVLNSSGSIVEDLKSRIRSTLLKINGEKKSTIRLDKFLKEYISKRLNSNYASIATTIFPMLGILGTFVSIAISMPNFSVSSTKALDREISLLLGGVGTAFYASIFGIFLSIWWMIFDKRGVRRVERFIKTVKNDFSQYIWDNIMLEYYTYAQNQMHNEELIDSMRESFNIHFMKKFNDSYIQSYTKLMQDTKSSFENISKDLQESSNMISKAVENITKSDENIKFAVELDKKMNDFQDVISSLDKTLDKTFEKIDSEVADIVTKLSDFAEVVVQKSDEVEKSLQNYHKQVKKLIKE